MWFMATLVDGKVDESGKMKEIKATFNTDNIKMLVENHENPETCMMTFTDGTQPALIKGSYEQNSKVLMGFNRR